MGSICVKNQNPTIDGLYSELQEDQIPYCSDGSDWAQGQYNLPKKDANKLHSSDSMSVDHFDIVKVIGRGSFGKVYLVRKKDS